MNEQPLELDELRQAVEDDPDDEVARGALVEALLESDLTTEAVDQYSRLVEDFEDEPWIWSLGLRIANATNDHIRAANLRRKLRRVEEDSTRAIDSSMHPSNASAHPSTFVITNEIAEKQPHLRLVSEPTSGGSGLVSVEPSPARAFNDIAGLAKVKENLRDILSTVQQAEYQSKGPWLGGTLFYGPPSCGKKFCASVLAGELHADFWTFDLHNDVDAKDLAQEVRRAVSKAKERNVVLYFDNIDALPTLYIPAVHRELLPVLDSARTQGRVAILGAATYPWLVSPTTVRMGRLGRVLLVLPPDAPSRKDFITREGRLGQRFSEDDIDWIVAHTEGHSFGDLDRLIKTARADAQARGVALLDDIPHESTRAARRAVSASSAEWLSTAGHHAMISEEGGMYDDLLAYFHAREK